MEDGLSVEIDDYTVRVFGELDLYTEPILLETVGKLPLWSEIEVVVDLGECTFMDCAGLHGLLRCSAVVKDAGGKMVLRMPSLAVRRVLELSGVNGDAPFEIEPD
jgi:anti-sigma B factor antagonist